jgi:hypothetical protein
LTQKDERSELIVCPYCASHVNVSAEERAVLGKGPSRKWKFALEIGDSWRGKQFRYEVIARLAYIEDGDESEAVRDYLLYNPRRGAIWLSEYQGRYSLFRTTHVMPLGGAAAAFSRERGQTLQTADGRAWVCEGTGEYELAYVDGALPWLARVGDKTEYAEFAGKSGTGARYEAQKIQNEIEFGEGEPLTLSQVRERLGKTDFQKGKEPPPLPDAATARRFYRGLKAAAFVAILLNLVLAFWASGKGQVVLAGHFSEGEISGETLSAPFEVKKAGDIVEIDAWPSPSLDNAWMALDIALVKGEDRVVHVADADMSYYHGTEGGESWSEGSGSESIYVKVPEPGIYHVLVHGASAPGDTETADSSLHGLDIRVRDGVRLARWHVIAAVLALVVLVAALAGQDKWKARG